MRKLSLEMTVIDTSQGLGRYVVPLVLLVLLALTVRLEMLVEEAFRGSPSASLLEVTRPPDYIDPAMRKTLEDTSRESILAAVEVLVDRGNPLSLEPSEIQAVSLHARRLSALTDEQIWWQFRLVELVDDATLERHRDAIASPMGSMRSREAGWDLVNRLMDTNYPQARREAARRASGPPPGWTPDSEPELLHRWARAFGDGSHDLPSDAFLGHQVRYLVFLELSTGSPLEPDAARRLAQAVAALERTDATLAQQWILVYSVGVAPSPERRRLVRLGPWQPDLRLDQMADGLRVATGRVAAPR